MSKLRSLFRSRGAWIGRHERGCIDWRASLGNIPSAQIFGPWRVRLAAQDTALSRRRSRVRIPYALPGRDPALIREPVFFCQFSKGKPPLNVIERASTQVGVSSGSSPAARSRHAVPESRSRRDRDLPLLEFRLPQARPRFDRTRGGRLPLWRRFPQRPNAVLVMAGDISQCDRPKRQCLGGGIVRDSRNE